MDMHKNGGALPKFQDKLKYDANLVGRSCEIAGTQCRVLVL
jgi:hypothetical protein